MLSINLPFVNWLLLMFSYILMLPRVSVGFQAVGMGQTAYTGQVMRLSATRMVTKFWAIRESRLIKCF